MDNRSNYTFSNKYNPSMDYNIFSEQNSRIINNNNNNTNLNYKTQTNNYLGVSYFNNTSNMNNSINNTINQSNNNSFFSENYSKFITNKQKTKLIPKISEENTTKKNINSNNNNINNNQKKNGLNFMEEFDKIKNIMNNDPSRNPNIKPQDCLDIYGYPFFNQNNGYNFSQFNNAFKQKYLMKTLFDNKYIYINGKQYHRIMKRREMRKKIKEAIEENLGKNKNEKNKKYHHESRHRHAMNRERGKGGRFISKKKSDVENNDKNKEDMNKSDNNSDNKDKEENNGKNNNDKNTYVKKEANIE